MTEREQMVAFSLQIPLELYEESKRMALQDLRPIKQELIVLLQEAVDGRTRNT